MLNTLKTIKLINIIIKLKMFRFIYFIMYTIWCYIKLKILTQNSFIRNFFKTK